MKYRIRAALLALAVVAMWMWLLSEQLNWRM